jgi:hypothetical protein
MSWATKIIVYRKQNIRNCRPHLYHTSPKCGYEYQHIVGFDIPNFLMVCKGSYNIIQKNMIKWKEEDILFAHALLSF